MDEYSWPDLDVCLVLTPLLRWPRRRSPKNPDRLYAWMQSTVEHDTTVPSMI